MRRLVISAAIALCALACASASPESIASSPNTLDDAFTSASVESGVPRDLLVAIARVEGGLTMPKTRDVDLASQVPVAGPLELRRGKIDTLALGASLLGASETDIRSDADLGLRAGALVLAKLGRDRGARASDLQSFELALEDLSGFADSFHRARYAREVFAALQSGGTFDARDGATIALAPHAEIQIPILSEPEHTMTTLPEYPGAEVFPTDCTNKCDTTRGGASVGFIVIHDTEGGWNASVATLQNDTGKSVQYIVNTDGTVGQFVPESYTAWHDGNYYYNQRSVGIEHVGYYEQSYPDAEYAASAKLVAYLTNKYDVPKDRDHIVGHDQIPNGSVMAESSPFCESSPSTCETGTSYGGASNHRDPGDWEWCTYMPRFGGTCKCNDVTNLWNCSADKTEAVRCTNGKVELQQCTAGCIVKAIGSDDECDIAASDAGTLPDASAGDPPKRPPSDTPSKNGDTPQSRASGCSASPSSSSSSSPLGFFAAALTLVALRVRRRR